MPLVLDICYYLCIKTYAAFHMSALMSAGFGTFLSLFFCLNFTRVMDTCPLRYSIRVQKNKTTDCTDYTDFFPGVLCFQCSLQMCYVLCFTCYVTSPYSCSFFVLIDIRSIRGSFNVLRYTCYVLR